MKKTREGQDGVMGLKEQFFFWKQKKKFARIHKYQPDLEDPETFNEKILWRKIYDRNPLFPVLMDKFRARSYVRDVLGNSSADKILIPLLFCTQQPEEIPFDSLPEEYVVKPNHGSGWVIMVDRGHPVSKEKIISKSKRWLKKKYGQSRMEWAYGHIKPCLMVEKLLKDRNGRHVPDFKFHVFNGRVQWVKVILDRYGNSREVNLDRDFNLIQVCSDKRPACFDLEKPSGFEEMVRISEKLATPLDYLRVDLYCFDGEIFFGEFTLYPNSGFNLFDPADFDRVIGGFWKLERNNARYFEQRFR